MGTWIAVGIALFVLGSVMGLKPSTVDVRLDKLRMTARKLELNPKLIACPDWLRGKDNEFGKGMMGRYSIVIDGMKLPHIRYMVLENQWRAEKINEESDKTDFSLDKMALDLPKGIEPYVKGLEAKANGIHIYWEDVTYVRPATNPTYSQDNIETDLLAMKDKLTQWAKIMEQG